MKILFLEDRPSRQKQFLPNKDKDVEKLKSISELFMPEAAMCKSIISEINSELYQFENIDLQLIIVHKSALETKGMAYLNKICKEKKLKLICFSGGTSQIVFNNEEFEFLYLNSSDFYTERLIPFLEKAVIDKEYNLLEITSVQWKLSYLLLARQIFGSIKMEVDEDSKFRLETKLQQIRQLIDINDITQLDKEIAKNILKK
jgi:hypothetical protein